MHWILPVFILTVPISLSYAIQKVPSESIQKIITVKQLTQNLLDTGRTSYIPGIIADLIDMPREVSVRSTRISKNQTSDEMTHRVEVAVEKSTSSENLNPLGLAWSTDYSWPGNNEAYYFRTDTTGVLVKALIIYGKRDTEGRPIRGAGVVTEKDIHSPEIKKRFQHELDFWLKGAYRKK